MTDTHKIVVEHPNPDGTGTTVFSEASRHASWEDAHVAARLAGDQTLIALSDKRGKGRIDVQPNAVTVHKGRHWVITYRVEDIRERAVAETMCFDCAATIAENEPYLEWGWRTMPRWDRAEWRMLNARVCPLHAYHPAEPFITDHLAVAVLVRAIKRELLDLMVMGELPDDKRIRCFGDLHEWLDANMLGDGIGQPEKGPAEDDDDYAERWMKYNDGVVNPAQTYVSEWLAEGLHEIETERIRRRGLEVSR